MGDLLAVVRPSSSSLTLAGRLVTRARRAPARP